jgi:hypothetical protein
MRSRVRTHDPSPRHILRITSDAWQHINTTITTQKSSLLYHASIDLQLRILDARAATTSNVCASGKNERCQQRTGRCPVRIRSVSRATGSRSSGTRPGGNGISGPVDWHDHGAHGDPVGTAPVVICTDIFDVRAWGRSSSRVRSLKSTGGIIRDSRRTVYAGPAPSTMDQPPGDLVRERTPRYAGRRCGPTAPDRRPT